MILAIGNINMDWICIVPHLPAPDEKINIRDLKIFPGGAASNFAVSLARLGSNVALFGHVGDDTEGRKALQFLQEDRVDTSHVVLEKNHQTGFVLILVGEEGQTMKLRYRGANNQLSPKDLTPQLMRGINYTYAASVSFPLAERLAKVSLQEGIRSAIDIGEDLVEQSTDAIREMICNYSIVFMNAVVFRRIFKTKPTLNTVQAEVGGNLEALNITIGAKGSITATPNTAFHTPIFEVTAVDTTGAGDAYAAGFIHFLQQKYPIQDVAKRAAACAALQVTQTGGRAGLPAAREVEEFIKTREKKS